MNVRVEDAYQSIRKVQAMMHAYDKVFLDLEVVESSREKAALAEDAFFLMWDAVNETEHNIKLLQRAEDKMCSMTSNRVRKLEAENAKLRSQLSAVLGGEDHDRTD